MWAANEIGPAGGGSVNRSSQEWGSDIESVLDRCSQFGG
jgi:hypothetical protein